MTETNLTVRGVAHDLNNQLMILVNVLDRMVVLRPESADERQALKAAEACVELTARLLPRTPRRRTSKALSVRN